MNRRGRLTISHSLGRNGRLDGGLHAACDEVRCVSGTNRRADVLPPSVACGRRAASRGELVLALSGFWVFPLALVTLLDGPAEPPGTAQSRPNEVRNSIGMRIVEIPGGRFEMGSVVERSVAPLEAAPPVAGRRGSPREAAASAGVTQMRPSSSPKNSWPVCYHQNPCARSSAG